MTDQLEKLAANYPDIRRHIDGMGRTSVVSMRNWHEGQVRGYILCLWRLGEIAGPTMDAADRALDRIVDQWEKGGGQ